MARSIDLDHLLLFLVIAQQVSQLGLRFVALFLLQSKQSPQLAHLYAVSCSLHRHDALDLLDETQRLPAGFAFLEELGAFDWR